MLPGVKYTPFSMMVKSDESGMVRGCMAHQMRFRLEMERGVGSPAHPPWYGTTCPVSLVVLQGLYAGNGLELLRGGGYNAATGERCGKPPDEAALCALYALKTEGGTMRIRPG